MNLAKIFNFHEFAQAGDSIPTATEPVQVLLIDVDDLGLAEAGDVRGVFQCLPSDIATRVIELVFDDDQVAILGKAVDGRDLRNILLLLQDMSELVDQVPDGFVALSKAAELSRVSLKNILELLFAGFLSSVFRWKGDVGFAAIRVNPDEVKSLLISSPPGLSLDLQFSML